MKKFLYKFLCWVKGLFKKEEEVVPDEIPLEDAFRKWREQNAKRNKR
jgi:hypothetical protein